MKFYQTPGGTWATSEKDWATAMKEEGLDPKKYDGRRIVEVPTSSKALMEFLTFHSVNVVNPRPLAAVPEVGTGSLPPAQPVPAPSPPATTVSLEELFAAAPIRLKISLAVSAFDAAEARIKELGG